jgi:hypothetical protein
MKARDGGEIGTQGKTYDEALLLRSRGASRRSTSGAINIPFLPRPNPRPDSGGWDDYVLVF